MAARLQAAGMPQDSMQVLAPPDRPKSGALIAVLPGRDRVARARSCCSRTSTWSRRSARTGQRDPFKLVEEDGYFYARGSSDDKAMAAVFTDILVRFKTQGFQPKRGLKLALTCGEETSDTFNSVQWLMQTRPETLKAQFVLNEGAGGLLGPDGKQVALDVQAGEKTYQDFTLETTNPGGHSSRPGRSSNAINELAAGLTRLAAYQFPVSLNDTTRAYFEAAGEAGAAGHRRATCAPS